MSAEGTLHPKQFDGYTLDVQHDPKTQWGLPALHVKAQYGGKAIGGLSVHQRLHDGDSTPRAHPNVWVKDEHQRRGVATAMYAEVARHWPDVPIEHSEHASASAKALNQTLARKGGGFGP